MGMPDVKQSGRLAVNLWITLTLIAGVTSLSCADSSSTKNRDEVLKRIDSCLQSNDVSSRKCKHQNQDVQTLVEIYRKGDKSVLPTLFEFTYLTEFYDETLLSDGDDFLIAISGLPEKEQRSVADGIAGGMFGIKTEDVFEQVRARLQEIPDSSPAKAVSQLCLRNVEIDNASYFVDYFPPLSLTGPAAKFQIHWFSREMYALGERPLWPQDSGQGATFRLTVLPAFSGPSVVTLTIGQSGATRVAIRKLNLDRQAMEIDEERQAPQAELTSLLTDLDQAHFWAMPSERKSVGLDGADWILEGKHGNTYHVVERWCPNYHTTPEEAPFADALRLLFKLAGYPYQSGC